MDWLDGDWAAVDAGDYVLGRDGYVWLVTAMATVGGDTHVWIWRPGPPPRAFDFPLQPAQPVRYARPVDDPQAVEDAVNALKSAGFDLVTIDDAA